MVPRLPTSGSNWNNFFLETVFEERGNQSTQRKTSQSKGENQEQSQPTHGVDTGFEPAPHWWEASAVPSLAPQNEYYSFSTLFVQTKKTIFLAPFNFVYSKWGLHREFSLIWQDKLKEQRRYWQVY